MNADRSAKIRYLNAYRWAMVQEQELLRQIEEARTRAERVTQALSGTPGTPGDPNSLERAVEALIDLQQRLAAQIEASCKTRCRVEAALCTVRVEHYSSGIISTDEFIALKENFSDISDSKLQELLSDYWDNYSEDSHITTEKKDKLYKKIHKQIEIKDKNKNKRHNSFVLTSRYSMLESRNLSNSPSFG